MATSFSFAAGNITTKQSMFASTSSHACYNVREADENENMVFTVDLAWWQTVKQS
jgi:hypothetical protein